eukprot:gb/GECG01009713.1/.p1 GENE.gb/GECG01009713.1/~~gb/GECG01009713.1/.p1  ORF type:complete len:288 (+),score=29.80 gb/GECG01009713.1/:1-864(+)
MRRIAVGDERMVPCTRSLLRWTFLDPSFLMFNDNFIYNCIVYDLLTIQEFSGNQQLYNHSMILGSIVRRPHLLLFFIVSRMGVSSSVVGPTAETTMSDDEEDGPFQMFSPSATAGKAAAAGGGAASSSSSGPLRLGDFEFMRREYCHRREQVSNGTEVVIMTYNVLADAFVRGQFSYCPDERLEVTDRQKRIQLEIEHYEPDVVCMQEVEYTAFSEVWMPFFEDRGWTGIIATESKTGVGVATFYCKKKLALQESRKVTLGTVMKKKFNDMEAEVGNWLPFGRLVGK